MSDELRPCPFCGGPAMYMGPDYQDSRHVILCNGRDCLARPTMRASTRRHVILDWNNRPVEDALRAQWDSVPWEAIYYAIDRMASYAPESKTHLMDALDNFYQAYAPKEAAE